MAKRTTPEAQEVPVSTTPAADRIAQAFDALTGETVCTICGRPAADPWADVAGEYACVARIHDRFATADTDGQALRRALVRRWAWSDRLTGIPGLGDVDADIAFTATRRGDRHDDGRNLPPAEAAQGAADRNLAHEVTRRMIATYPGPDGRRYTVPEDDHADDPAGTDPEPILVAPGRVEWSPNGFCSICGAYILIRNRDRHAAAHWRAANPDKIDPDHGIDPATGEEIARRVGARQIAARRAWQARRPR